jgi:TRAP-type C4-dicarboxylate transport system permease small subunit
VERRALDGIIDAIELMAGAMLAIVTANSFVSVILRYFFNSSIPDTYDFGRFLLGILIFWGIAVTSSRGEHITVDLVWSMLGRGAQRAVDVFAALVTLGSLAVLTLMMGNKVLTTRADNVLTFDLNLPVWVFFLIAWLGLAAAVVLLTIRTLRVIFRPEGVVPPDPAQSVE